MTKASPAAKSIAFAAEYSQRQDKTQPGLARGLLAFLCALLLGIIIDVSHLLATGYAVATLDRDLQTTIRHTADARTLVETGKFVLLSKEKNREVSRLVQIETFTIEGNSRQALTALRKKDGAPMIHFGKEGLMYILI